MATRAASAGLDPKAALQEHGPYTLWTPVKSGGWSWCKWNCTTRMMAPRITFSTTAPWEAKIQPENQLKGDGGKRLCADCSRMAMSDLTGPGMHP